MPQNYQQSKFSDDSRTVSKRKLCRNNKKIEMNVDFSIQRNDSSSRSRRIDSKIGGQVNRKPLITFTGLPKTECGDTYCTHDPNYPSDVIASLNTELQKFEYLFGDDFVDTLALRFDSDESGLCQSRRRLVHPKRGKTVQNTWLTIINDDDKYRQGVTIEECQ